MKKYYGVFFATFAFALNFLCFWYSDFLFNRYFIFGLIPLCLAIIVLIASMIISIVFVVRNKNRLSSCISLGISIISIIFIFFFPFRMAKVNFELTLLEKDRLEIVEMIKDGKIVIDDLGNAKLPKGYGHLSSDGEIFVYQNDNEQVISFWVFRGMLSGSIELIYSSVDESLIYANESGHPITNVEKLKDHWYLVDTDY